MKTLLIHVIALCSAYALYTLSCSRTFLMPTFWCFFIHVSAPSASAISALRKLSTTRIIMLLVLT